MAITGWPVPMWERFKEIGPMLEGAFPCEDSSFSQAVNISRAEDNSNAVRINVFIFIYLVMWLFKLLSFSFFVLQ